ncbi:MAG: hypothetical protein V4613_00690 [Bacteroidota bacterium]
MNKKLIYKWLLSLFLSTQCVVVSGQIEQAITFKITASQVKLESLDLKSNTLKNIGSYSFKFDPYNTYACTYNIIRNEYLLECDTAIIVLSSSGQLLKSFSKTNDIEGMEYDPIKKKVFCCVKVNNSYVFSEMNPETGAFSLIKPLSLRILFSSCIDYERGFYYIISDVRGLIKIDIGTGKKIDSTAYFITQNCQANEVDLMSGELYTVCIKGTRKFLQRFNPVSKSITTIDTLDNYATGFFGFNASAFNQTNGDWLISLGKNIGKKNVRTNARMDTLTVAFNSVKQLEYPNQACYFPIQIKSISSLAVNCSESNDGKIAVILENRLFSQLLSLDSGKYDTSTRFSNLVKGAHKLFVKDVHEFCTIDTQIFVGGPEPIMIALNRVHNKCYRDSGAIIHISVQGGSKPYQYALNQSAESSDSVFRGLINGQYTCTVTDGHDCKDTVNNILIESPDELLVDTVELYHNLCYGNNNGALRIVPKGGVTPYEYAFENKSWGGTGFFDSLPANVYSLSIRDKNGCEVESVDTIKQPVPLKIIPEIRNVSCLAINDGQVSLKKMVQQSMLTMRYYILGYSDTLIGLDTIKGLTKGVYHLKAFNEYGCSDTSTIVIQQPQTLKLAAIPDTVLCKGQYFSLKLFDPLASTYSIKSNTGLQFAKDTLSIDKAGTYYVRISNIGGCSWLDTFVVKKIDLAVMHNFLAPTQAFVGDTIYAFNMSEPLSEMNEWKFSKQPQSLITAGPDLKMLYNDTGKVTIALKSKYDACTYAVEKQIYIYSNTDSGIVYKNKGLLQSQIMGLEVFSNPHDGVHFSIRILLRDSMDCSVYKIDPTGYITGEMHFVKLKSYVFTAFESDNSEVYYLKLVVGRESKVVKVVAVK